ncbi:thiamine pyrophosphate-binding protein [Chenggangzhangella methanolivorans]|uniref:Thiamine pyrophosphate-binding protein n=1 Tax=Chenggangzhangella methanolivorans TaxID=1437009 RepID=A0A9E6RE98_9HYPH|nr:thiamine pyrophosphate-binding protein [Chenggangzhangella methanolivorans]QZO01888.1 thiamine pyrophosphate-binding protein [Chenggangzhangella methanolivorans]
MAARTGAEILVDALLANGLRLGFGVPGESYLAVLEAMRAKGFDFLTCRQEGGAAMMADAAGKLTGRPGLCFATRGPGAANAFAGVHVAAQDSTPMILFVGQIARGFRHREAFQELDHRAVFGSVAKWAVEIDDAARIPELVSRAIRVATQGRPGPVIMAMPEDMLDEAAEVADAPPVVAAETWPGLTDMAALQKLLWAAERPIALVGGSRWSETAVGRLKRFAERFALPVAATFRRQMLFPADHACYAGDLGIAPNPKLRKRVENADLVLLIGGRLGEMPSQGYEVLSVPAPRQKLVHVHPDPEELGRVYQPALAINASPTAFAAALEAVQPPQEIGWRAETEAARADYLDWTREVPAHPGEVQMREVMAAFATLPPDAIVTNGAGNYSGWFHRFHRVTRYGSQAAPTSGSMGYGLPGAIAAKRLNPEREVVALAGDGCFLMTGQELATAVQYGLGVVALVFDNGQLGTIRMHQEREFPDRPFATALRNPDFADYARAFGAEGFSVTKAGEFADAFGLARAAALEGRPAVVHVRIHPDAISATKTLDEIREGKPKGD